MQNKQLQAVAYHEAGHAVMGFLLGRKILGASVIPDESSMGRVEFDTSWIKELHEWDERFSDEMVFQLLIHLAGPAAEEIYTGEYVPIYGEYETDIQKAVDAAEYLVGNSKELDDYLDRAYECATIILTEHWEAVKAVADSLLKHRQLDGWKVSSIIRRYVHLPNYLAKKLDKLDYLVNIKIRILETLAEHCNDKRLLRNLLIAEKLYARTLYEAKHMLADYKDLLQYVCQETEDPDALDSIEYINAIEEINKKYEFKHGLYTVQLLQWLDEIGVEFTPNEIQTIFSIPERDWDRYAKNTDNIGLIEAIMRKGLGDEAFSDMLFDSVVEFIMNNEELRNQARMKLKEIFS